MKLSELDQTIRQKVFDAFYGLNSTCKQLGDMNYSEEERACLKEFYLGLEHKEFWLQEETEVAIAFLVSQIKNYDGEWTGNQVWGKLEPYIGWRPDYKHALPRIYEVLNTHNRPTFKCDKNSDNHYAVSLFYQAFSPQSSVKAFIELAWSLYISPFFSYSFIDSTDEINRCQTIIEFLDKHYKDIDFDSDIKFESCKYSIRAGLRYAFDQDKNGSIVLLRRILRYIDYIYQFGKPVDAETEGYLASLCNQKVPELLNKQKNSSTKTPKKALETVDGTEKISASYLIKDGRICLYFPRIRLYKDDQQNYKNGFIRIYACYGDVRIEISNKSFECVGDNHLHELDEIYYPIHDLLTFFQNEISLSVVLSFDDNDICFDSKKTLFRKIIVFKDNKEKKTGFLPDSYQFAIPLGFDLSANIISDESPTIFDKNFFSMFFNKGDRIDYNNAHIFFGDNTTDSTAFLDGQNVEVSDISIIGTDGIHYDVFKKLGFLIVKVSSLSNVQSLDFQIVDDNGEFIFRQPLSNYEYNNDVYSIDLCAYIDTINEKKSNLFLVAIKDLSNNTFLFSKYICFLPDILITHECCPYSERRISHSTISFHNDEYKIENSNLYESCEVKTSIGNAIVKIPYFSWQINQNDSFNYPLSKSSYYLKDEFQSNDTITIKTYYNDVRLFCGRNEIEKSEKNTNCFLFGRFKNSVQGNKAFYNKELVYAKIIFTDKELIYPLFSVADLPYITDNNADNFMSYVDHKLSIYLRGVFHGDKNSIFHVKLESCDPKGHTYYIPEGKLCDVLTFDEEIEDDLYHLSIDYMDSSKKCTLWKRIWSGDRDLRDVGRNLFSEQNRIRITEISGYSIPDLVIKDLSFVEFDGMCQKYSGTIEDNETSNIEIRINTNSITNTKEITLDAIFYSDSATFKEFSFDAENKKISKEKIDGTRYRECFSIKYIKL